MELRIADLLEVAKKAAVSAGECILKVYDSDDFGVEVKSDDSPLTKADRASHIEIVKFLETTNLPILSEEGGDVPYEIRKHWDIYWLIDPLDGTKEFVKRNGEFTVNIALIKGNSPILGVVYAPVLDELFYGCEGVACKVLSGGEEIKLSVNEFNINEPNLKVVASRSHLNHETQEFIDKLKDPHIVSKGSSLKFLLVAEGCADLYPRFAPTMEWDTAAAHAVVNGAGGKVLNMNLERNSELKYNKEDLRNPYFLVSPSLKLK